jgi:hypothetical protein
MRKQAPCEPRAIRSELVQLRRLAGYAGGACFRALGDARRRRRDARVDDRAGAPRTARRAPPTASPNASRRPADLLELELTGLVCSLRASPKRYLVVAVNVTLEEPQLWVLPGTLNQLLILLEPVAP